MPTTQRTRTIAAPAGEVWELVSDPHHLPRWWPRVARVEGV
ncbi:MAG: SRPBCC family protein, partial [Solirubrobacteraceae bacterium]